MQNVSDEEKQDVDDVSTASGSGIPMS